MDPLSTKHRYQRKRGAATMQYAAPLKGLDNRVESTYHGVAPAYSGLTVLPNSCSADYIALRFDRAASKESLPMS